MAINEPNKPNNVINIDPGKKSAEEKAAPDQPLQAGGEAPAPEVTGAETVKPAEPDKAAPSPEEKAPEKAAEPEKPARRGRPAKAEKEKPPADQNEKKQRKPRAPKEKAAGNSGAGGSTKEEAPPPEPEQPPIPRDATRNGETEQVVYLNISELYAFKDHPFGVRDDTEMKALVESVKNGGVNQPALVRPCEGGGYEIIAGHRRQKASEMARYANMPCIVRNMTDDEAILAMTDDNLRQRSKILPSEKAQSLKMQVEAIKHQGARDTSGQNVQNNDAGKWSIDVVGERNNMNPKQVQRYIRLTELVPDLSKAMDEKKLGFTPAVELSFVKPKNQNLIAVSLEGQSPTSKSRGWNDGMMSFMAAPRFPKHVGQLAHQIGTGGGAVSEADFIGEPEHENIRDIRQDTLFQHRGYIDFHSSHPLSLCLVLSSVWPFTFSIRLRRDSMTEGFSAARFSCFAENSLNAAVRASGLCCQGGWKDLFVWKQFFYLILFVLSCIIKNGRFFIYKAIDWSR